jgi:hypothetical protein
MQVYGRRRDATGRLRREATNGSSKTTKADTPFKTGGRFLPKIFGLSRVLSAAKWLCPNTAPGGATPLGTTASSPPSAIEISCVDGDTVGP